MRKLPVFRDRLKAFSAAVMDKTGIESGNKSNSIQLRLVILPHSVLIRLTRKLIQYPMFFRLRVPKKNTETYCGVHEFIATERTCILPWWMMNNLLLTEGEQVEVEIATLPKGTAVCIQPFEHKFAQTDITKEEYAFNI